MALPKSTPPDRFSVRLVAIAAGFQEDDRRFHTARANGLGPTPVEHVAKRGGVVLFDTAGLEEWALAGAFHRGGLGLLASCRLARAIFGEIAPRSADGITNLGQLVRQDASLISSADRLMAEAGLQRGGVDRWFWVHRALRGVTYYEPRKAISGDLVLEVLDGRRVALAMRHDRRLQFASVAGGPSSDFSPLLDIQWSGRGDLAVLDPFEGLDLDFEANPDGRGAAAEIEAEYAAARENAVAIVRLNVSLAIRNAFDLVHDFRVAASSLKGADNAE
jgi:hypothetical protein